MAAGLTPPSVAHQDNTEEPWRIPRMFDGEEVAILGGGPSLTQEQVNSVIASGVRIIAINNSYKLVPTADILYFCDARWWDWHKNDAIFKSFNGMLVTLDNFILRKSIPNLKCVRNVGQSGISLVPGEIKHGSNSGYQCLNIALQLGFKRAYLFGYDMRYSDDGKSHWHAGHPVSTPKNVFSQLMVPLYAGRHKDFLSHGLEVINCTPNSALTEFPYRKFDECLSTDKTRASLPA